MNKRIITSVSVVALSFSFFVAPGLQQASAQTVGNLTTTVAGFLYPADYFRGTNGVTSPASTYYQGNQYVPCNTDGFDYAVTTCGIIETIGGQNITDYTSAAYVPQSWIDPPDVTSALIQVKSGSEDETNAPVIANYTSSAVTLVPNARYNYNVGTGEVFEVGSPNSSDRPAVRSWFEDLAGDLPSVAESTAAQYPYPGYNLPRAYEDLGNDGFIRVRKVDRNIVAADFTTPGSYSWTVPAGVTSITVEEWGAGGGGGSSSPGSGTTDSGAGGGGGYSKKTYSVTPGATYTVAVGFGGPGGAGNATQQGATGGNSYFKSSSNPFNMATDQYATGGSGGLPGRIGGAGGSGFNADSEASGNAGESASGFPLSDGGVSGKTNCLDYYNQVRCENGYQDNNAGDAYGSDVGMDNAEEAGYNSSNIGGNCVFPGGYPTTYCQSDTPGGSGYAPGNGGADGAGSWSGGNGGNGEVLITWANTLDPSPTSLTAVSGTCNTYKIDVSWNKMAGASSYNLYRNGVVLASIPQPSGSSTTVAYSDTGRPPSTLYDYTVSAVYSGNESPQSAPVYQFSPSLDCSAPQVVLLIDGQPSYTISTSTSATPASTALLSWTSNYAVSATNVTSAPSNDFGASAWQGNTSSAPASSASTNIVGPFSSAGTITYSISVASAAGETATSTAVLTIGGGTNNSPGGAISGTCTASSGGTTVSYPNPINLPYGGGSVTFAVTGVSGGTAPYSNYWNGSGTSANTTAPIPYSSSGSGSTVVIKDSSVPLANQASLQCPLVNVASAPAAPLGLYIAPSTSSFPASTAVSLSVERGNPYALEWVNTTASPAYTCSMSVTGPSGTTAPTDMSNWISSSNFSTTNTASLTTASDDPIGTYGFDLSCNNGTNFSDWPVHLTLTNEKTVEK